MGTPLIKIANKLILFVLLLLHVTSTSLGQPIRKKSNLQFFTVSVPIGYGALSAYHALPSALPHAPYALRGLNHNYLTTKIGSVRTLDFKDEEEGKSINTAGVDRPNYSLDLKTFVRLFGHEFQEQGPIEKYYK